VNGEPPIPGPEDRPPGHSGGPAPERWELADDAASQPGEADSWERAWDAREAASSSTEGWRLSQMMLWIAGIAICLWLYVIYGGIVIAGGIVILFASAIGLGVILARRQISQQDSLLWILAIAAQRGMPLGPTLTAFADQYGGRYRRRILRLAELLDSGCTVPEALGQVPRIISRDALLLAHVGQRTGRLPEALRMAASSRANQLPIWTAIATRFAYLLFILLAIQTICGFLLYFILPKFEAIFKDFGIPLPMATIHLIEAAHFLIRYGPLSAFVPPLEVILLILLPFSFAGWANYDVPIFDRMLRRRHTALILRALSLSIETGKPIEAGMETVADHYPTWWIRRKLIRADDHVRQGAPWIDELYREGLIRGSEAEVLHSASLVGNLPWAMRELAETGERRLAFRFQAVIQTLFPLVVLSLGVCIFLLCFAFFAPLIELIGRLSG
jgi:protein transport protein HofC